MADVINAFCVIDYLVFGGKITAEELLAAMKADFDENALPGEKKNSIWESLALRMKYWFDDDMEQSDMLLTRETMKKIKNDIRLAPKYGAGVDRTPGGIYDNSIALDYTNLITGIVQDTYYKYRTHRGGRYLTGYWSMTNHAGFGMLSKATPNGRKKGAPFASGITPCAGIVKRNGEPVMILDHIPLRCRGRRRYGSKRLHIQSQPHNSRGISY